jgi:hypothetical protein
MKSGVILLTIALCALTFANATENRLKRTAVSKVRDVVEAILFGEEKLEELRRNIPESKGNFHSFFVVAVDFFSSTCTMYLII